MLASCVVLSNDYSHAYPGRANRIANAHSPSKSSVAKNSEKETLDALPFDLENIGAIEAAKWIRTVFHPYVLYFQNEFSQPIYGDKATRGNKVVKSQNQALLAGLAYCISSCSMILVNKFVLSSYNFDAGISLMLYQNLVSVIIVSVLSFLGIISTEPLTWRLVKVWLPVNVIFVGMLITSMFSLKYINVAMVTVLKNVTNVITAIGEMYLFQKHHDSRVWAALFLMIISAISGGVTDLSFHAVGYAWQIINCFLTASYSLTLRRVMDTAKLVTKSGKLNEFSRVLLNNTLSLPLGIVLIFVFREVDYLFTTPLLRLPNLLDGNDAKWIFRSCNQLHVYVVSSSNRCHHIQPCGSLNKIPLSVAGILLFKVPTSLENSASIFFGLVAGVFFARAKMRERSQS
ncbi:unnamed protein product [Prunus armeniaca]|uniref:Sugar phosphate transporter domain-containing protein n=1 Tax=Prunus armeniaca TaxID=36596 RepID=A0A6J5VMV1_PRUAR|nr:unnamed protein product [Prunus armeniaca]